MKTEIMPIYANIMIKLYSKNPYDKQFSSEGLLLGNGEFENSDSGEKEKLDTIIKCAEVIEVGPDCKYIQKGDDVYINEAGIRPVPFMRSGFFLTNEQNVLAVMSDNLNERFKK